MRLLEYEAKEIFREYGVRVPRGGLARNPEEARIIAEELDCNIVLKAQILGGGRGKGGGVLFAKDPLEAEHLAERLIGGEIRGQSVKKILVEEVICHTEEIYLGLTVDRASRRYVVISSLRGGVDIEEVARETPGEIVKTYVNPLSGIRTHHAREIAKALGYSGKRMIELASTVMKLYKLSTDSDADLVEINPLTWRKNECIALDARMNVDDNALFRHKRFEKLFDEGWDVRMSRIEYEARKLGLSYVEMEGNIGVIGNGAGLVMATLDLINFFGGKPSNFLDLGGGATQDKVATALRFVLSDPKVEVILVNVLGGITRCDDVARGILKALDEVKVKKPTVIRLLGSRKEEAERLLEDAGLKVLDGMEEAVEKAVEISQGSV